MIPWLQKHMLPCAYKSIFGIDCPICGAQRSLILMMQGNFTESFKMYPPLLFVLMLIFLVAFRLLFPSIIKAEHLKKFSVIVLIVISINYAFKIVSGNV